MSTSQFTVFFTGKIIEGESVEAVKAKLVSILGIPAQQVDKLFLGKNRVVKSKVDQ